MKMMPLQTLDFQAVADIRRACGAEAPEVLQHVAEEISTAYRVTGRGMTGTAVLAVEGRELLVEALAGTDRAGKMAAKVRPMVIAIAKAHGCLSVRAHAKSRTTARLYRRLFDRQISSGSETISRTVLA